LNNTGFAQGAPVSPYAASYSIVTETGNDNSNIMQTGDKHVWSYPRWPFMVSVGTKRSVCYPVWWEPKAVIGSHGDKNMAKIVQKTDSI
jgi:hypothetical protein